MRFAVVFLSAILLPGVACAGVKAAISNWSASLSASTSTQLNSEIIQKPQYGFSLSGRKGLAFLGADLRTAHSGIGTDSEDKFFAGVEQKLKPFTLRYELTYRVYPGTLPGYHDSGLTYSVNASRSFLGVSCSLGAGLYRRGLFDDTKALGYSVSLGRGLAPKTVRLDQRGAQAPMGQRRLHQHQYRRLLPGDVEDRCFDQRQHLARLRAMGP